jgi:transcriptional regulator with XRE-family HTH domain
MKTNLNTFISKRLKELREKQQLTQSQVAQKLNIESSTYQKMEKGISQSWNLYLDSILELYNIDIKDFFEGFDNNNLNYQKVSDIEETLKNQQSENIEIRNMECELLRKQVNFLQKNFEKLEHLYETAVEDLSFWKNKFKSKKKD